MLKKLLPLLFLALLTPAPVSFAAEPQDILTGWSFISPDTLGLRLSPDLENEAVRVDTKWPVTICITPLDVREQHLSMTTITYSVQMKSAKFDGAAYLEMWLHVPGGAGGNFVVRGYDRPLRGNSPWSKFQVSFALDKGQVPDQVTLNLVINGKGTVWFKDVKLQHQP